MIQINLLPVREARRKADLRQLVMQIVLALILVAGAIGVVHSRLADKIGHAEARITQMQHDIKQFDPQLKQVAAFRKKKAQLEKKIDIIAGLDRARKGPVRVMDELASNTPARLWLESLRTEGEAIELKGQSLDNELVAVFLGSLGDSPYFDKVDLNSTKLGKGPEGLEVVEFVIEAQITSPKDSEPETQS